MINSDKLREPIILICLTEAGLALAGALICWVSGSWPEWNISWGSTLVGILSGLALFVSLKKLALVAKESSSAWALEVNQLKNDFAEPLAKSITARQAIISGSVAGLAEEFFFRGSLENLFPLYLGTMVSGAVFVALHFGRKTLEWRFISILYLLVSFIFSAIYQSSNSLWAAALCHGLYDYLALRFLQQNEFNIYTAFPRLSR